MPRWHLPNQSPSFSHLPLNKSSYCGCSNNQPSPTTALVSLLGTNLKIQPSNPYLHQHFTSDRFMASSLDQKSTKAHDSWKTLASCHIRRSNPKKSIIMSVLLLCIVGSSLMTCIAYQTKEKCRAYGKLF
uniref:Transmembrane protein n=1 Tax=Helianthus annuus TaxID=4232 RepID=A0A251VNM5_HELAN